jgi:hypothetical protein
MPLRPLSRCLERSPFSKTPAQEPGHEPTPSTRQAHRSKRGGLGACLPKRSVPADEPIGSAWPDRPSTPPTADQPTQRRRTSFDQLMRRSSQIDKMSAPPGTKMSTGTIAWDQEVQRNASRQQFVEDPIRQQPMNTSPNSSTLGLALGRDGAIDLNLEPAMSLDQISDVPTIDMETIVAEQKLRPLSKQDLKPGDILFYELNDGKTPSMAGAPNPDSARPNKWMEEQVVKVQKTAKKLAPAGLENGDPRMRHVLMWTPDENGNEIIQANYKKSDPDKQKVMGKTLNMPGRYLIYRPREEHLRETSLALVHEAAALEIPYDKKAASQSVFSRAKPSESSRSSDPQSSHSASSFEHPDSYFCSHLIARALQAAGPSEESSDSPPFMKYNPSKTSPMRLHHMVSSSPNQFELVGFIDIAADKEKKDARGE